jgi:hypothetical protein
MSSTRTARPGARSQPHATACRVRACCRAAESRGGASGGAGGAPGEAGRVRGVPALAPGGEAALAGMRAAPRLPPLHTARHVTSTGRSAPPRPATRPSAMRRGAGTARRWWAASTSRPRCTAPPPRPAASGPSSGQGAPIQRAAARHGGGERTRGSRLTVLRRGAGPRARRAARWTPTCWIWPCSSQPASAPCSIRPSTRPCRRRGPARARRCTRAGRCRRRRRCHACPRPGPPCHGPSRPIRCSRRQPSSRGSRSRSA